MYEIKKWTLNAVYAFRRFDLGNKLVLFTVQHLLKLYKFSVTVESIEKSSKLQIYNVHRYRYTRRSCKFY